MTTGGDVIGGIMSISRRIWMFTDLRALLLGSFSSWHTHVFDEKHGVLKLDVLL